MKEIIYKPSKYLIECWDGTRTNNFGEKFVSKGIIESFIKKEIISKMENGIEIKKLYKLLDTTLKKSKIKGKNKEKLEIILNDIRDHAERIERLEKHAPKYSFEKRNVK